MSILDRVRRPGFMLGTLLALFAFAAFGCGGGGGGGETTANQSENATDAPATTSGDAQPAPDGHGQTAATSAADQAASGEPGVVHLVDKGCVQFEPHWITIAPGQTVTWANDTNAPVTVRVDGGAFAKAEYVVAPGARVTSGPAGAASDYKVSTEPNACQGPPLGARGSGPGVAVQTAAGH